MEVGPVAAPEEEVSVVVVVAVEEVVVEECQEQRAVQVRSSSAFDGTIIR